MNRFPYSIRPHEKKHYDAGSRTPLILVPCTLQYENLPLPTSTRLSNKRGAHAPEPSHAFICTEIRGSIPIYGEVVRRGRKIVDKLVATRLTTMLLKEVPLSAPSFPYQRPEANLHRPIVLEY